MADITLSYRPAGPVTAAFHASDAFVRGLRGPIGSGKSTACTVEIFRRAWAQAPGTRTGLRRSRWAIIRNTLPQLKTTTIKTWTQWVPAELGRLVQGPPPIHRIRVDDVDCEVIFLALDKPEDVRKLLSLELTGAWVNEAREVPRAVIDGLTGRVGRFPEQGDGGPSWSGILLDTNPPDTDHWWYRLAEEQTPEGWHFFAQPPGDGAQAENLAHLPPRYYQRASAGKDEDWVRVYVRGEYGFVRDGKPVYPEYRDHLHCASQDLPPWPRLPLIVGVDFGLTPAAALCQRSPRGQWRILGELVAEDVSAAAFGQMLAAEIARLAPGLSGRIWCDPAGQQRGQGDGVRLIDHLARHAGLPVSPAPSNVFTVRREAVAGALNRLVDGEPGLLLSPAARTLRKGFAGHYRYRRVALAGLEHRYRDQPDKNPYSHPHDALQYALLGGGEGAALRAPPAPPAPTAARAITDYDILGYDR